MVQNGDRGQSVSELADQTGVDPVLLGNTPTVLYDLHMYLT